MEGLKVSTLRMQSYDSVLSRKHQGPQVSSVSVAECVWCLVEHLLESQNSFSLIPMTHITYIFTYLYIIYTYIYI